MTLLMLAILLPLVGGVVMPLFHFQKERTRSWYVEAVVIATSVLCWVTLFQRPEGTFTLMYMTDHLSLSFRLDQMSMVFVGLVSFLWPLASLYGFEYMRHEERPNTFFTFYTMTYGITLAVAMAGNLFTLYVFYECLTLITLPLVTHKQDPQSIRAGHKYLIYSISGAALAFIAMIFIIHYGSTTDFVLGGVLDPAKTSGHEAILRFVFLLAFIGFGTKAALFPMYAWLPAASVAPTPVTALLHAVAVVDAGAFAVLRVIYYSFGTSFLYGSTAQIIAVCLSCFTILFGSTMAVKEQHFKRRLAYSTVSNLSYMLMGAALMTPAGMVGSLSHLVFHGLMKITLFYCAGAVLREDRPGVRAGSAGLRKDHAFHLHGVHGGRCRYGRHSPAVRLREQVEPADCRCGHGLLVGRDGHCDADYLRNFDGDLSVHSSGLCLVPPAKQRCCFAERQELRPQLADEASAGGAERCGGAVRHLLYALC